MGELRRLSPLVASSSLCAIVLTSAMIICAMLYQEIAELRKELHNDMDLFTQLTNDAWVDLIRLQPSPSLSERNKRHTFKSYVGGSAKGYASQCS
ncbi:unnamed protein product [Toxocara canis]|uniref:Col_cuticle_N domain-containing protein n=1 Tax=Toxocara canis TaxID=6265 RepID=A0A183U035_TOXCA|nr:unnamed protein product [Toxocara canis]